MSNTPKKAGDPFTIIGPFEVWWVEFYGEATDYQDPEEYWTRKAFAWWGWEAATNA